MFILLFWIGIKLSMPLLYFIILIVVWLWALLND